MVVGFVIVLPDSRINLAYAELYIVIAGMFRKYNLYDEAIEQKTPTLALYDTTRERDVNMEHDFFLAFPREESKGVRVKVR